MQNAADATTESTLADLPLHDFCVSSQTKTTMVTEELKRRPELPGVIVADADELLGVVSRAQHLDYLGRPFHVDLYGKRPIALLLETTGTDVLVMREGTTVHEAAREALSRPMHLVYEPIVVVSDTNTFRLLDVHTLMLAQSR